ncbi:MAG: ATP-binding protein [Steroidobacteraceae bacterium]
MTSAPQVPRAGRATIGLGSWLGGGSAVVVAIAVAAMAFACSVMLARLVEGQALARVQLAAASGRDQLRRIGEDSLSDARVLAERPTLQRLLATQDMQALRFFLQRFCDSSLNDACAILAPEGPLASVGAPVPWAQVGIAIREQGERFILAPADGSALLWGAGVAVTGSPQLRAVAIRVVAPAVLGNLGAEADATLRLQNFTTYAAPDDDPFTALHTRALAAGGTASAPIRDGQAYGATIVVATPVGEVAGLLDADLDGAAFASSVQTFQRWLVLAALAVAAIAGVAGLLYGRWLARPVEQLRDAAQRFGRGDLSVAVPAVAPTEVGALARTMEDMRRNLTDLTEALRRSEAEARAVLGGITEGVYAVDAERRIRYANPQAMRLLRLEESQAIGRFCGDVLRPRADSAGRRPCETDCPILRARSGAAEARAAETLCLADGSTRSTVIVSAAPVAGQQVQVLRDETDLEAARRARDSVLGNISHEFRTPLAAQLASVEMLRDGLATLGPVQQAELLANVERGVLRLMRLIDNLLESVRIESGQLEIRRRSVDLDGVVDEALALLGPLFTQRRLRVMREGALAASGDGGDAGNGAGSGSPPDSPADDTPVLEVERRTPTVIGDAQRLVQVLVNLLANAIKFAPEGSTLRLGASGEADARGQVELWVEDEGAGFAGGDEDAIFARFRRSAGDEPDAPGLGLGLWIVKSIVERHGGTVRAGRTPLQRTRFTVSLPAESP